MKYSQTLIDDELAIASQKELDRISGIIHLNHTYLGTTK